MGETSAGNKNFGVINIQLIFKAMTVNEIMKGVVVGRKYRRYKPEPQGTWRMLPRPLVKLGQSSILPPTTRLCPLSQAETAHGSGKVGKVAT